MMDGLTLVTTSTYSDALVKMLVDLDFICFKTFGDTTEEWDTFLRNNNEWYVFSFEHEGVVIAAAAVCYSTLAGISYLYSSAVQPEYRRKGIGEELLKLRLGIVQSFSSKIQVHTRPDNKPIIKLLQKYYFEPIAYIPDFYSLGRDGILWELKSRKKSMELL
jgi:ribosomal protein S18 acetylase RimI-like enzyme